MCASTVVGEAELALERDVVEVTVAVRRWDGRRGCAMASSSSDPVDAEFGGEASPGTLLPYTRAYGARVRSVGSLSMSTPGPAFCFLGNVMAQFSHGPARLVVVSS